MGVTFLLVAPLLTACTAEETTAGPAPLPTDRGQASRDVCAELVPDTALKALEAAGVRPDGAARVVQVPLTPPGATSSVSTEGCELRFEGAPLEGVVIRRVFDARAIGELRKGIARTTDELARPPAGWELRWSDAAATGFAFRAAGPGSDAYVVQLVLQRARVDRKQVVRRLVEAVIVDSTPQP